MSLDKSSAVPLYCQLKNLIISQIDSDQLKPHQQLPSERELSERSEISRHTVRQAVNELVTQGILYRQPGKGTYVAPHKITQDLLHVTSFTQLILDWGKTSAVRLICCHVVPPPAFVMRLLDLGPDIPVINFERVRLVDREPVALHKSYVPYDIGQPLLNLSLDSESLLGLLANECGVVLTRSQETMEPTVADAYEAQLLKIEPGAPLQLITGRLLTDAGRAAECHKSVYRGDIFQFAFEGVLDRVPAPGS
jgi:GntR family transcriptional regulator